jgi:penicillin-binding protein 1C
MARAVRSPGSTLKPLIYGLAFEAGLAHPDTLIDDRPMRFGSYVPKNFDHDWHGTVTMREALAQSLNIPAVSVLEAVGPQKLFGRLQQAGLDPQLPKDAEPTLAVALGGLGLRLVDLAQLYAGLARGGENVVLTHRRDEGAMRPAERRPLLTPVAAWYVADILRHAPAPVHAKGGQIAFKTGTSYGARDAWAAGFDGRHTIAVWVGRADGAAVPGLAGRASAAPLLFDAFQRIAEQRTPLPPAPAGVLRATGADLPPPLRRFNGTPELADAAGGVYRARPLRIASPPDRADVDADGSDGVMFKADGGTLPLTWLVDGAPVAQDGSRRELMLGDKRRGFVKVSVIDATGKTDRVTVRIK